MPYMIHKNDEGRHCVYKKDAAGEPTGESLGCHDSEEKAQAQMRALYASEMASGFLYADLAALTSGRPFDGFAASDPDEPFIDMHGNEIAIKPDELPQYLENTRALIEATRTESGELVGLPIDANGHEKGDGAGYIVGVELTGSVLQFVPQWAEIGLGLLQKGIRRWFSATADIANKAILGGTLTNWPATRKRNGRILLRPIELSKSLFEIEEVTMEPEIVQTEQAPNLAELVASDPGIAAQVRELVQAQVKAGVDAELSRVKRETHVTELCQRLTGGTDAHPQGLPVKADELQAFLLSLDDPQRERAEALLASVQEKGLVSFTEAGHSRPVAGGTQLPDWAKAELQKFITAGYTVSEFFVHNGPELGEMADYNLSEFTEKKEN
jgi:hypothetical protein